MKPDPLGIAVRALRAIGVKARPRTPQCAECWWGSSGFSLGDHDKTCPRENARRALHAIAAAQRPKRRGKR